MDCVYCECGKTTCLTNDRKNDYDPDTVLKEIEEAVKKEGHLDFITFAGSGEPSLFKDIKKIVKGIKKKFPHIKLAIITNSTLLTDKDVFEAFLEADVLLPSIDSVREESFKKMNRPHPSLKLDKILEALLRFKKEYKGKMWAEVFICHGINDTDEELTALRDYLLKLNPDKLQINTLDRKGTEDWVQPLDKNELKRVIGYFKGLNVEPVARKLS
jgi:wyosine [tRNA(Phe)-imidazoG37] synthetase (radical SAM superfamily)